MLADFLELFSAFKGSAGENWPMEFEVVVFEFGDAVFVFDGVRCGGEVLVELVDYGTGSARTFYPIPECHVHSDWLFVSDFETAISY